MLTFPQVWKHLGSMEQCQAFQCFPQGSAVENHPAVQETSQRWVQSLGRKIPWRRKWQTIQYSCQNNPRDRGAWQTIVQGVENNSTQRSCLFLLCYYSVFPPVKWHEAFVFYKIVVRINRDKFAIVYRAEGIRMLPIISFVHGTYSKR